MQNARLKILLSFLLGFISNANAQTKNSIDAIKEDSIYVVVDEKAQPNFELITYISKNLPLIDTNLIVEINGKIIIQFIVEIDGTLNEIKVTKGFENNSQYRQKLIDMVKDMPKWDSAKINGTAVRSSFFFPINICF